MKVRILSLVLSFIMLTLLSATALLFCIYALTAENLSKVEEKRFISLELGNELLLSSLDLTRCVREYVMTGDSAVEKRYYAISDERSGKAAREAWRRLSPGKYASIIQMLADSDIPQEELALAQKVLYLSNELIPTEIEAMQAIKGWFRNKKGEYVFRAAPDKAFALHLVTSREYNAATHEIIQILNRFSSGVVKRVTLDTQKIYSELNIYRNLLAFCLLCLACSVLVTIWYSVHKICIPLEKVTLFARQTTSTLVKNFVSAPSGDNEINTLRAVINTMVLKLKQRIHEAELNRGRIQLIYEQIQDVVFE